MHCESSQVLLWTRTFASSSYRTWSLCFSLVLSCWHFIRSLHKKIRSQLDFSVLRLSLIPTVGEDCFLLPLLISKQRQQMLQKQHRVETLHFSNCLERCHQLLIH